jgi:hypothetical protein
MEDERARAVSLTREERVQAPPPALGTQRGSLAGASAWGRSKEGHRMQALCTYCRAMTTPAPSRPGRPRLCSNCLRPYEPSGATLPAALGSTPVRTRGMAQMEPVASPLASVAPQGPTPSLPTRAPEQRARAGGDHDAPRTTPTGADAIWSVSPGSEQRADGPPHAAEAERLLCSAASAGPLVASQSLGGEHAHPGDTAVSGALLLRDLCQIFLFPSSRDARGTDYKPR